MARNPTDSKTPLVRVLIVDDHPAVREALTIRLSAQADLEVCGEATDTAEALRVATATHPDVAVIDIALKTGDGLDLIKRLKARNDKVRAIVWSMFSEELYAERALRAGAMGYLTKEQATVKIVDAIRHVVGGNVYLSDAMAEKLLRRTIGKTPAALDADPIESLSDRELEVFRLIGQGHRAQEIATRLHLSVKTVETYRDRIRHKLDLQNGAQMVQSATQWVLENG